MPEITVFTSVERGQEHFNVPDLVTAHNLKVLVEQPKTAYIFLRLLKHDYDAKCKCYSCENIKWWRSDRRTVPMANPPTVPAVRLDIGAKNSRLPIRGGELFIVVPEENVDDWLNTLGNTWVNHLASERYPAGWLRRLALLITLPAVMERSDRKRKKSLETAVF